MEREKLHRFFAGKASVHEGMVIKAWMEASEENMRTFYKERRLFDALLLHGEEDATIKSHSRHMFGVFAKCLKIAAIIALTLSFSYMYQMYRSDKDVVALNTVSVPAGQRTNLILPDGTNVWLNARTTLQYSTTFNKSQRKVILEGEAYFDVTHNEKMPFIVQTQKYDVEVLGTQFDVDAYPDQEVFETTLMKGSVKVTSQSFPRQTVTLDPNHKVSIRDGDMEVSPVDDFNPYRWKEGLICFKDESLQIIMKEFEKYYGIRIIINNHDILKYSYNGKFRQSDGIDYALRVLQNDIHFSYVKDNDEQTIYIN